MANEPINPIILTLVLSFVAWLIWKCIKIKSDQIGKEIDE
mgnify:CR=1 FL=1